MITTFKKVLVAILMFLTLFLALLYFIGANSDSAEVLESETANSEDANNSDVNLENSDSEEELIDTVLRDLTWGSSFDQVLKLENKNIDGYSGDKSYMHGNEVTDFEGLEGYTGRLEYWFESNELITARFSIENVDSDSDIAVDFVEFYYEKFGQPTEVRDNYYFLWETNASLIEVSFNGNLWIVFKDISTVEISTNNPIPTEDIQEERIITDYYSLTLPIDIGENYFYDVYENDFDGYVLTFYETKSFNAGFGGMLFSIELFPDSSYSEWHPSFETLGIIETPDNKIFYVVATYPTDVQFTIDNQIDYMELEQKIPQLLATIEYNENCSFTSEVISNNPIDVNGPFIGKWTNYLFSNVPNGASNWTIEFLTNGTCEIQLTYELNDIENFSVPYSRYDTYLGEGVDGIILEVDNGRDINLMLTYSWSNELQKMIMSIFPVKDGGVPDLDNGWGVQNY